MKHLLKLNLQLFAEDDEPEFEIDDFEIDDDGDDDLDIELGDDDDDLDADDKEPEPKDKKKDERTVPLKVLEEERKKWKEKLKKLEGQEKPNVTPVADGFDETKEYDRLFTKYQKAGYDDYTAKVMAEDKLEDKRELYELRKSLNDTGKSATKIKREIELENLASDPHYSDIHDVREDVERLADKAGLTLKQAYNALFGETKYSSSKADMKRQIEQEVLENLRKKNSAYVDTVSNGEVDSKPKVKLTPEELAVAKAAKMSPQEYYAMKKMENIDHYKKFKSKKKG
jgi:hypothetical protein